MLLPHEDFGWMNEQSAMFSWSTFQMNAAKIEYSPIWKVLLKYIAKRSFSHPKSSFGENKGNTLTFKHFIPPKRRFWKGGTKDEMRVFEVATKIAHFTTTYESMIWVLTLGQNCKTTVMRIVHQGLRTDVLKSTGDREVTVCTGSMSRLNGLHS